jgi:hypothetical protein
MNKKTKILLALLGLGGLGFFLYKKGLFTNKMSTKDATKEVVKVALPVEDKYVEVELPVIVAPPSSGITEPTIIYPPNVEYPKEGKLAEVVVTQTSFDPYLYDQPPVEDRIVKIDYTSDRYNNGLDTEYAEKDLDFIRNNRELFM